MLFLIKMILEVLAGFWAVPDVGRTTEQYVKVSVPLYYAALNGDIATVERIVNENPEVLNAAISNRNETILHAAVRGKQAKLVEMLAKMTQPDVVNLDLKDGDGNTAFFLAVASGSSEVVDILMQRRPDLAKTRGDGKIKTPFEMATLFGHSAIALNLYPLSKGILQEEERKFTFFSCVHSGLYDLALTMLKDYPDLALARENNGTALHVLARKPSDFPTETGGILITCTRFLISKKHKQAQALDLLKELWGQVLLQKGNDEEIRELIRKPTPLVIDAAEAGNYEFLVALICSYHNLLWEVDKNGRTIFHIAVMNRHVRIFRLIHEIGSIKDIIAIIRDHKQNNILHLAAELPATERLHVSGAALQMQNELLWFEEVKNIYMHSGLWEVTNAVHETPQSLFSRKHKDLLKEGEEWMKKTAESCSIVAALIATVVFSTAFSVPGGNSGDTGIPIQIKNNSYTIFTISNGVAMFTSSTSILMFLSILTSRYLEHDFLRSLPWRLMVGLTTLFISMATMTVAFCMAFFIAYRGRSTWIPILVATLQLVPVSLFLYLLYPLLRDIFCSTFLSRSLFNPNKRVLRSVGTYRTAIQNEKEKNVPGIVSEHQV